MEYTTQTLAKELKISPRTLRYYDEIGLLSPKIRMMSGRCIYGIEEVFTLLHILKLKEFGFSLEKIQSILSESGRYKVCALKAQKAVLLKQQIRQNKSLELIDIMIEQSKQEKKMDAYDINMPSHWETLKSKYEYMKYFDESYVREKAAVAFEIFRQEVGDEYYHASQKKASAIDLQDAGIYGGRMGQFLKKAQEAKDQKWLVDSKEVQELIKDQWETLKMIYPDTTSKKIYLAIRDQICHSQITQGDLAAGSILEYISQAMGIFAETNFADD